MSTQQILVIAISTTLILQLAFECETQSLNRPSDSSQPRNSQTIQQQLQQILDQEEKLKVMRQKLLQELKTSELRQDVNMASGNAKPDSPKFENSNVFPRNEFPFTEVQLESTGIRILNSKPNRRVVTS